MEETIDLLLYLDKTEIEEALKNCKQTSYEDMKLVVINLINDATDALNHLVETVEK